MISKSCLVCLGTWWGFQKYCEVCLSLLMVQETKTAPFSHRVFCCEQKCVKKDLATAIGGK